MWWSELVTYLGISAFFTVTIAPWVLVSQFMVLNRRIAEIQENTAWSARILQESSDEDDPDDPECVEPAPPWGNVMLFGRKAS